jgi:hypothetical protein
MSATTISYDIGGKDCYLAGLCTSVPGATTITFDGLASGTASPYTYGLATYTWDLSNSSPFVQGPQTGEYAPPVGDSTTFLTAGSPGRPTSIAISFSLPVYYFGMYMGSPDPYNSISFFDDAGLIRTFSGDELINPGNGSQGVADYVNFRAAGGAITHIVMSSSSPAFETDNHAYAMPEPGTAGVVVLGLGLGLIALRRRLRS